jgi:hypothetical protein
MEDKCLYDCQMRIDFTNAKQGPVIPPEMGKTKISIRLDNRVIEYFRGIVEKAGINLELPPSEKVLKVYSAGFDSPGSGHVALLSQRNSARCRPVADDERQFAYRCRHLRHAWLRCNGADHDRYTPCDAPPSLSFHFGDTAFVIQWHVLAMFAPSFVTGELIRRFGVNVIMSVGALLGLVCVSLNLAGTTLSHFWFALVALGVSWNFLFIGGTTLLTETYEQAERAKVQAANDFIVFTTVALSSLSAGYLQHRLGWQAVNWGVVPLLSLILGSLGWLGIVSRPDRGRVQA